MGQTLDTVGTAQVSRFRSLAYCWADILFELDIDGTIVFADGVTMPVLGKTPDAVIGMSVESIVAESDRSLFRQLLKVADRRGRIDGAAVRLEGVRGTTPPLSMAGHRLGENRHFFLALRLGMPGEEAEPTTENRDEETGLFEGGAFSDIAAQRVKKLQAAGEDVKMTLVSMGNLPELRSRLDEAAEQSLLNTVGACFRAHSADGDSAARIDDGRYGLVHDAGLDVAEFEKELADVTRDVDPTGKGVEVEAATISLPETGISEEDMAKSLVFVVNRFRDTKGGDFSIRSLSSNIDSLMQEAHESVDSFKKVVANASFDLAFQPIVDSRTGEIHHYEALTRFRSAGKDESPYRHITFAEETGMIAEFDLAVVDKAIEWLGKWPRNTARYKIAVNISGHSVGSDMYVTSLHRRLKQNDWVRDKLLFEITESSRMADLGAANSFIQGLRKAGHHLCLDDFGAGAASFQYLSALDVDVVKLDGSAIRNAQRGPKGRAFLTALSALCRSLTVETIAEMIDKDDGLFFVRDCGVDYVQGYLFGQPSRNIKDFDPLPKAELFKRRR
ncbi:MAG: EAL domain-containing protein [Rhodospirillales bacterium]|nr:EAL domain-containing protein [Rhodospirillales bacterium]